MPTDLTTAEKAERLGLERLYGTPKWYRNNPDKTVTLITSREVSALYAERFPAPDYRAALEALVEAGERAESAAAFYDNERAVFRAALHKAKKVLHGQ